MFFITIRYVKPVSYVMWSCEIIKIKKQKTYFPYTFMNAFTGKNVVFSDIDLDKELPRVSENMPCLS